MIAPIALRGRDITVPRNWKIFVRTPVDSITFLIFVMNEASVAISARKPPLEPEAAPPILVRPPNKALITSMTIFMDENTPSKIVLSSARVFLDGCSFAVNFSTRCHFEETLSGLPAVGREDSTEGIFDCREDNTGKRGTPR